MPRFQPGISGNARGRPRSPRSLALAIRLQIEPFVEQLVDDTLARALSGDSTAAASLLDLYGAVLAQTALRPTTED
ncbi:DUF5681 domain-containing protein [Accumulibacter sp.]|uniref:DUF5681 domain-containing protein n=1 Tax=Accumulibacter sp. TaxID=2053492 RepID=UPI00345AE27C